MTSTLCQNQISEFKETQQMKVVQPHEQTQRLFFEPYPNPKIIPLGPQKVKNFITLLVLLSQFVRALVCVPPFRQEVEVYIVRVCSACYSAHNSMLECRLSVNMHNFDLHNFEGEGSKNPSLGKSLKMGPNYNRSGSSVIKMSKSSNWLNKFQHFATVKKIYREAMMT